MIIVDLLCYLTGGCINKGMTEMCHKALSILYERVQPIILTKKDLENSQNANSIRLFAKKQLTLKVSTALNTIVRSQVHPSRFSKLVPPLKDIPDEIFQDSGEDSDFKANKLEIEQ